MNIQIIKIENLKSAEYNPRKDLRPEDEEYQRIKRSIVEYGCIIPLVVNKDMKEFELKLDELTDDERQIILDGCLINYYKSH